ncbi:MAG: DUF2213 domain-containing protein, partial [Campylobacter sp.]|nr:DUF2213 domain-containing protein [Campylobacter sp.]
KGALMLTLKIQDKATSKRSKDANGFLIIKDNPIAKAGVFDYLLSELKSDINADDDRVVKVYRPFDELERIKDSFANKPIKMNHHWVGDETNTADGAIGSIIEADEKNGYLRADLIIYNPELIEKIEAGELIELSPAYTGEEIDEQGRFNGEAYEFKQKLGEVNHLAVVETGRSGKDLKIYDSKSKLEGFMRFKDKLMSKLSKFIDSELSDEECKEDESLDRREIIREIMAISAKPAEEFQGGEDEKIETIAKLAEKLAYDKTADEDETEKKSDSDEVEAKSDEETAESDKIDIDEVAEAVAEVVEKVTEQKLKEFADSQKREAKKISDAYSEVKKALGGDFDSSNMSVSEIYKFGYEALSNSKLDKRLDSKTAFLMAVDSKKQSSHKTSDSESVSSNILKLLKEKY